MELEKCTMGVSSDLPPIQWVVTYPKTMCWEHTRGQGKITQELTSTFFKIQEAWIIAKVFWSEDLPLHREG